MIYYIYLKFRSQIVRVYKCINIYRQTVFHSIESNSMWVCVGEGFEDLLGRHERPKLAWTAPLVDAGNVYGQNIVDVRDVAYMTEKTWRWRQNLLFDKGNNEERKNSEKGACYCRHSIISSTQRS